MVLKKKKTQPIFHFSTSTAKQRSNLRLSKKKNGNFLLARQDVENESKELIDVFIYILCRQRPNPFSVVYALIHAFAHACNAQAVPFNSYCNVTLLTYNVQCMMYESTSGPAFSRSFWLVLLFCTHRACILWLTPVAFGSKWLQFLSYRMRWISILAINQRFFLCHRFTIHTATCQHSLAHN